MIAATANHAPSWMVCIPILLPILMAGIPAVVLTRGERKRTWTNYERKAPQMTDQEATQLVEFAANPHPQHVPEPEEFEYEAWRHGGWYWFCNAQRYPSGGCGCVSRNYPDRKWRIACDSRPEDHTYPNRSTAALAEWHLMRADSRTRKS